MALVCEPCVKILNRRFVTCHWNAFNGRGADAKAMAFSRGKNLRYGAIATPKGEVVTSFGFGHAEFERAIRHALKTHPKYNKPTEAEKAVFAKATESPGDAKAQYAAAQIRFELLQYDKARAHCKRIVDAGKDKEMVARAHYLMGHIVAVDITHDAAKRVTDTADHFRAIEECPKDIADDMTVDLIQLKVRLKPKHGFFTGYEYRPGTDLKATIKQLESWIESVPNSNRIGQMHFLLGLARFCSGDTPGANKAWKTHVDSWPGDRFAMLSRIHHTDYVFSPCRKGGGGPVIRMTRPQGK